MCAICLQNGVDPLTRHPQSEYVPPDTCRWCRVKYKGLYTSALLRDGVCVACEAAIQLEGLEAFTWRQRLKRGGFSV